MRQRRVVRRTAGSRSSFAQCDSAICRGGGPGPFPTHSASWVPDQNDLPRSARQVIAYAEHFRMRHARSSRQDAKGVSGTREGLLSDDFCFCFDGHRPYPFCPACPPPQHWLTKLPRPSPIEGIRFQSKRRYGAGTGALGSRFLHLRDVKRHLWNHKRVHWIACELELSLRTKRRLKRAKPGEPAVLEAPESATHFGRRKRRSAATACRHAGKSSAVSMNVSPCRKQERRWGTSRGSCVSTFPKPWRSRPMKLSWAGRSHNVVSTA